MAYRVKILRGVGDGESTWQTFWTERDEESTIATVLEDLNNTDPLYDSDGNPAEPIAWECACLEKKCGACAMVINGKPRLACSCKIKEVLKKGELTLEPLSKFPRIRDLQVDRGELFQKMQKMQLWLENEADLSDEKRRNLHYKAAGCLMCGLCIEVCPNCQPGGDFSGALAALASYRALDQSERGGHREAVRRAYEKYFFQDCAKSLSCQDICPMKIPIEQLLSKTNAAAVWRRGLRKK